MATFTVSNLNDSGAGSLRAAITAANADLEPNTTIDFSVSGTITLTTGALPAVTNNVTIDATSAPGHVSGGAPVVEVNFNGNTGLVFDTGSDTSQLLGLAICNASGAGVTLNAGSISVGSNYIGLDLNGAAAGNTGDGILVSATSSKNLIGLNPNADSHVISNVISGNGGNGVSFHGSNQNTLVNNYIGTDPTGTTAIANAGNGIWFTAGSNGSVIGGTAFTDNSTGQQNDPTGDKGSTQPTFIVPPLGNLISGNAQNGVLIDTGSQNNVLNGNFIGTDHTGEVPLGNTLDGVAIVGADGNALIGCTFVENPFVYYNVVSGNGQNGLRITDSDNTVVQANFFGIDSMNSVAIANALDGILVNGTSKNTQVGGVIPLGNVSSGNGTNGIEVADTSSGFVSFNTFAGLLAFRPALPNGNDGILITSTGGNQVLQTSVFSGNTNNGIEISGDASGITIDPSFAGTNTVANDILPNGGNGLEINGTAHNIVVGGHQLSIMPQNVFSGNLGYGISIEGNAHDISILNTFVGTSSLGDVVLSNQKGGIFIGGTAHDNKIGDVPSTSQLPNTVIVSGNVGNGITLADTTTATTILNNLIGLSKLHTPMPNTGVPIDTGTSTNNVISGNETFACFAEKTRIATPNGDIAVERLREGDLVWTMDGRAAPVKWIGHRHVDCRRHASPVKVRPVRIVAHAFGENQPMRDLLLSPDHAVYVEGVLIPIKYLVNGTTIAQVKAHAVTYFHIELDRHDVIMAEGLASESYLDTGDRSSFANGGATVALHPEWGRPEAVLFMDAMGCAPLRVTGREVAWARLMLADRARRLRTAPPQNAPASGWYSRLAGTPGHRQSAGAAGPWSAHPQWRTHRVRAAAG